RTAAVLDRDLDVERLVYIHGGRIGRRRRRREDLQDRVRFHLDVTEARRVGVGVAGILRVVLYPGHHGVDARITWCGARLQRDEQAVHRGTRESNPTGTQERARTAAGPALQRRE